MFFFVFRFDFSLLVETSEHTKMMMTIWIIVVRVFCFVCPTCQLCQWQDSEKKPTTENKSDQNNNNNNRVQIKVGFRFDYWFLLRFFCLSVIHISHLPMFTTNQTLTFLFFVFFRFLIDSDIIIFKTQAKKQKTNIKSKQMKMKIQKQQQNYHIVWIRASIIMFFFWVSDFSFNKFNLLLLLNVICHFSLIFWKISGKFFFH